MLTSFDAVLQKLQQMPRTTVSVANADSETMEAARMALDANLADVILYGQEETVRPLMAQIGLEGRVQFYHCDTAAQALTQAVQSVRGGKAHVLMKGMLNSSDFLRGVLDKEWGLRTGRRLSHIAAVELPGHPRLIYSTDGGMNICPDLTAKKDILLNALHALRAWGYACPKVACLAANERVDIHNQATTDAAALVDIWKQGGFDVPCVVEGPIAMDVALSRESALHKGIDSQVSGEADIFLMPIMEVGNVAIKGLLHFVPGSQVAGLILGARAPVVMTSRSEPPAAKLYATALGCLAAQEGACSETL